MSQSRPVRFEADADAEYREAGRWYEERRSGLGIEFFDAVDTAIRQIVDFPRVGVPVPRVSSQFPVKRVAVSRFPCHVVYLDAGYAVRIVAIAHDRRKPGYWKHRLP